MRLKDARFQSSVVFRRWPSLKRHARRCGPNESFRTARVELPSTGWARATHLELQPAPTQATSKAHAGLCPKITREFFRYLKQRNSSAGGGKLLPRSPPRHERARAAVCRGRGFCVTEIHGNLAAYQGPRSFPQVGGCARGARVPQTAEFSLRDPRPGLALQSSSW